MESATRAYIRELMHYAGRVKTQNIAAERVEKHVWTSNADSVVIHTA